MESRLSRRNFLKSAALGSVGVASLSMLGGCVPRTQESSSTEGTATASAATTVSSWKTAPTPVAESEITATHEAEVIVVGHGYAGLTACREIAESGHSVILIEKQDEENYLVNGNEGGVLNATWLLENMGVDRIDPVEFFTNWMMTTGNTANPALIMKYCQNSGANTDWYLDRCTQEDLKSIFISFKETPLAEPAEIGTGFFDHVLAEVGPYKSWASSLGFYGSCSQTQIHGYNREAAKEAGAEFFFSTSAQYLTVDDSGAVTGVVATNADGAYERYEGKAVVLATGGFGCDAEMVKDLLADVTAFATTDEIASLGTTMDGRYGDGIKMAYWAGAEIEAGPIATMGMKSSSDGYPCGIWLDENGKRFCNEFWGQAEQRGNQAMFMPRKPHYALYGPDLYETVQYCTPSHASNKPHKAFMSTLQQVMDQAVESDDLVTIEGDFMVSVGLYGAATIEELFAKMGVTDAQVIANVKQSVERYNGYCANGTDEEFGRQADLMWPLEDGPFFAQVHTASVSALCTMGGLVTDGEQNVLKAGHEPLVGLFASGNCTGRRFGRDYFTPISGVSLGLAWTLGRECGKSVVAYLEA